MGQFGRRKEPHSFISEFSIKKSKSIFRLAVLGLIRSFNEVIDDTIPKKGVKKIVLCTGKIYFDLLEAQEKRKSKDTAIVRLEQLHPFPKKQLDAVLKKYQNPKLTWVQEEPTNMGAYTFVSQVSGLEMKCISRKSSASPATGFSKVHKEEQAEIVKQAFK